MSSDPNPNQHPLSMLDKAFLAFILFVAFVAFWHAGSVILDVLLNS